MNESSMSASSDKKATGHAGNGVSEQDKRAASGTKRWQEAAAKGKVRQAAHTAQETFREDLSSFISEVESLLAQSGTLSSEALEASKAELNERMANVKTQLVDFGERTSETAEQAAGFAQDYIRARPLQSVGIALGVGAVIGYLLHRR